MTKALDPNAMIGDGVTGLMVGGIGEGLIKVAKPIVKAMGGALGRLGGQGKAAAGGLKKAVGIPFPCNAQPGQVIEGVDPRTLYAGNRTALDPARLRKQIQLTGKGIARSSNIEVNQSGAIGDGQHGAAAAAREGVSVDVTVTPGRGRERPITELPVQK